MAKRKLTKSQEEVWDRLNYVPKPWPRQQYVSSTVPVNPVTGSLFIDPSGGSMKVYDGSQWIDLA